MRKFKLKDGIGEAYIPEYGRVRRGSIYVGDVFSKYPHIFQEILEEPAPTPELPVLTEVPQAAPETDSVSEAPAEDAGERTVTAEADTSPKKEPPVRKKRATRRRKKTKISE